MIRITSSENGNTPFEKLIGHNKGILDNWNKLDTTLWNNLSIDNNLLEQVRRTMAFENKCEYCMVKAGKPDFDPSNVKISIACAFAEIFCKDHYSISEKHFDILKEYFSDKEISELSTFIAFVQCSQKLAKTFNLTEEYQINAIIKLKDII